MKQNLNFTNMGGGTVELSSEFQSTFPTLSALLAKAKVVDFTVNTTQVFRQYIWFHADGTSSGWLCQMEHCVPVGRNLIQEHILLAKNMGSILHYWGKDKETETFVDANEFTFMMKDSYPGIGSWNEIYKNRCQDDNVEPLDLTKFVGFALEANGNVTLYNHETKEVFLYAHDGYSSLDIKLVQGQPEYTIHQFVGTTSFVDYVEQLAKQWKSAIAFD